MTENRSFLKIKIKFANAVRSNSLHPTCAPNSELHSNINIMITTLIIMHVMYCLRVYIIYTIPGRVIGISSMVDNTLMVPHFASRTNEIRNLYSHPDLF